MYIDACIAPCLTSACAPIVQQSALENYKLQTITSDHVQLMVSLNAPQAIYIFDSIRAQRKNIQALSS